ncbi:hypothetical protein TWF481_006903 [Arthrobotrys musiformis]|uniref:F-box domain-containing protein n=1 Tax=Arthrobotrys musiformis TaxID=47236 RepID=A0AAV9WB94_9PEZI
MPKLSDTALYNVAPTPDQLDLLLPKFTGVRIVDLRNHEYTPDAALRQIRTIKMILASCPLLKDLSIQINCDSLVRLSELDALEVGCQPNRDYPRLTDLTIQLTETCYDNNLEPVQNLLDSLCKLLRPSVRTVKSLEFRFGVDRLADDWNYNPWYWPPRENEGWPRLDLPQLEVISLELHLEELCAALMLSEYLNFDFAKIKQLKLPITEKYLDTRTEEDPILLASEFISEFPNVEIIQLWPLVDPTWVHGILTARKNSRLKALREVHILMDGITLLPGIAGVSPVMEAINEYRSKHDVKLYHIQNPCRFFQDTVVIFRF